jgi:Zn-dependent protease with chaperone function
VYLLLGASIALVFYLLLNLSFSLLVAGGGGLLLPRSSPALRARGLLLLRLFPAAGAGLLVGGLFLPSYLTLEHPGASERPGLALLALAGVGLALFGVGFARGLRAWGSSRRLAGRWLRRARSVAHGRDGVFYRVAGAFPPACVVGILRPRVVVADVALRVLSPGELEAVLAHEAAHARRSDNLKRLLFRCAPDALGFLPHGGRLERAWEQASELAADREAASGSRRRALDLSSALIALSRLLPGGSAPSPFAAIDGGGDVTARVRALLGPEPSETATPSFCVVSLALLGSSLLVLLAAPRLLPLVHELTEALVRVLS